MSIHDSEHERDPVSMGRRDVLKAGLVAAPLRHRHGQEVIADSIAHARPRSLSKRRHHEPNTFTIY
jgi:hypothetical protein